MPFYTATIANGESLSGAVRIQYPDNGNDGYTTLCGIIVPSGWTTAVISFAAGLTVDGTFYPVLTAAGAEVVTGSITGGTAVWIALDPADFSGIPFIKIRSGTSAAAVNQSGSDSLTLVTRSV